MLESRLSNKISIYFIGMMSSKILSVLLIPLYAFYVSASALGYYDYMQTVMSITIPIVYIAIWEAILKFVLSESNEVTRKKVISTSAFFSMTITLFLAVLVFVILYKFTSQPLSIILLVPIMFVTYGLAVIWQYLARSLEQNKVYVFAGVVSTIINFLAVLILVCFVDLKLEGLFLSYIFGQFSIIVFIERKLCIRNYLRIGHFDYGVLRKMLTFSAPLVLNLISLWLMSAFGRFIITNELGTNANGLFSFANKFSLIITMIGSVITMAIVEEAILSTREKGINPQFKKNIELICKIFQCAILIAVPMIVIFYSFISQTDYYASLKYAPWLLLYAVATTVSANVGSIFQAINKTRYQFLTTVIGSLMTVSIAYIFIASIGIYSVIVGQIVGSIVMLFARYLLVNKYVNFKINWIPVINMTVLFIVTTIICLNVSVTMNIVVFLIITAGICFTNFTLLRNAYIRIFKKVDRQI
ncbi:lipopolysaccharide biosynthesis protein [Priestia aryabhattai]|uniref:lipopolysaccharide biosynthesis protein n=1 Tax=Priestia aryabhattai TaxID=412384 RepID=UPI001C8F11F2|nr:lipopolysaccharide biosynthesis protein [Priestia aryabhattai]MBY0029985.1 lipopolysaccharide biosynthesis protein [Priestia aryabhattai]